MLNQIFVNGGCDVGNAETAAVGAGQWGVAMWGPSLLVFNKSSPGRDRLHRTLAGIELFAPFGDGSRAFGPLLERSIFGYYLPVLTEYLLSDRRLAVRLFDSAVALLVCQPDLSFSLLNDCTSRFATFSPEVNAFE